jgi:translation initiation factor 3 subunit A
VGRTERERQTANQPASHLPSREAEKHADLEGLLSTYVERVLANDPQGTETAHRTREIEREREREKERETDRQTSRAFWASSSRHTDSTQRKKGTKSDRKETHRNRNRDRDRDREGDANLQSLLSIDA